MHEVWKLVHAERLSLITFLRTLDRSEWDEPSLCADWSVHDVVAHLVDTAKTTRISFITSLAAVRFDFHRHTARGVARQRGATPEDTLAAFQAVAYRSSTPPAPMDSRLVEAVVHAEDIRRPLGASGRYPEDVVDRALRLQLRTAATFGGGRERATGMRLVAEDTGRSYGTGPDVRGPALSLLLTVSGRNAAVADLTGPGVTEFAAR